MKVLFLLCSLLVLTSCINADIPDKDLHLKCIYPTVKIVQLPTLGGGSGAIVRSYENTDKKYTNIVITAAHIIEGDARIYVPKYVNWSDLEGFEIYEAYIVAVNKKYDLAILGFISTNRMYTADIELENTYFIGSKVIKAGYGLQDENRIDLGEITSIRFNSEDIFKNCLRINAETTVGDSGGPTYLSSNKKIIGLNKGMRMHDFQKLSHHAFSTPITFFKMWNKEENYKFNYVFDKTIPIDINLHEVNKEYKVSRLIDSLNRIDKDISKNTILREAILLEIENIKNNIYPILPEVDLDIDSVAPAPPTDK